MNIKLVEFIKKSFLSAEVKAKLISLLRQEGETEEWHQNFNQMVKEELEQKKMEANKIAAKYSQEVIKLKKKFIDQKTKLDTRLSKALADNSRNLKKTGVIWKQYHLKNKQLYAGFESELKDINKKISADIIKKQ